MLAEKHGVDPLGVIDFSSNINPYGPPARVVEAMQKALKSIGDYPEPHAESFVEAVSQNLGVSRQLIVAGNGSIELLHLIAKVATADVMPAISSTVLLPVPCFTEYELALHKTGTNIRYINALDSEEAVKLLSANAENTSMVMIGNPNNPCGYRIDKDKILRLVDRYSETFWVVDEAFIDFIDRYEDVSLVGEVAGRENLVVIRSLTKIFSLAGVRIGFAVAPERIAEKLKDEKYSWSINSIAIAAGIAALRESEFVSESVSKLRKSADDLYGELLKLDGINPFKPSVNYIMLKIETPISSTDMQIAMLKKGVAVRDCASYTGLDGDYIRVAVKTPEQNAILLEQLNEVLGDIRAK
jgi:threonine-phosphate decarboxylase